MLLLDFLILLLLMLNHLLLVLFHLLFVVDFLGIFGSEGGGVLECDFFGDIF